jgi:hypothetical protein
MSLEVPQTRLFVSRTVADLVVGSDIEFEDRGVHALKARRVPAGSF